MTQQMEKLIQSINSKLKQLESLATPEAIQYVAECLKVRNEELINKIKSLKDAVVQQELLLGLNQYENRKAMSSAPTTGDNLSSTNAKPESETPHTGSVKPDQTLLKQKDPVKSKPSANERKKPEDKTQSAEKPVDIGRLDMRVGRIIDVSRHPDADSLYVEKVDLGGNEIRTVVSGLVKFVPIEQLQNRVGIFMCNLKPAKMRGVESEAMLMCASAPETSGVEPLIVECQDIRLGDSVIVDGFTHDPDEQLNPKKKIFEQVKPDLRVNDNGIAVYKNVPWKLKNSPNAVIKSLKIKDAQIA
uniref:tRNA-binding domain-containing protein n=2 Tax=Trichobilharzia regenti TaxID=157069 RepID=A0AA85JPC2_TRIRE|nr:unnamed protein product [Trichobilharzia regenti]